MTAEGSTIRPGKVDGAGLRSAPPPDPPTRAAENASSGRVVLPFTDGPAVASPDEKTVISKSLPAPDARPPATNPILALGQSLAGKRLEHYELTEFVGGGGMGAVFRATDTRLGRTVAVKVLSRDQNDEETIRRFRNEAQSAARLDHPNIARVYYVGEDRGWNFIVFEFIEGTNLREVVEQHGPLDLEDALLYTLQVAEALDHSSSRDVVHRDIKPSNVLVTAGEQVKLVDMGLARLHQVESSSNDLTASGVTLGTFDYISPEQARDPRSADVRSDIYSLGCTLYFMLTGRPPFPDGTALQKLLRHNADEPPDLRIFRPDLHPRVMALLARMLAKRPSQRQQTARELCAEILALGQQLGLSKIAQHGQVVIAEGRDESRWRSLAWQVAAAAAVLAAAVVLADMYWPSPRGAEGKLAPPRFQQPQLTGAESTESDSDTGKIRDAASTDSLASPSPAIPKTAAAAVAAASGGGPENGLHAPAPASVAGNSGAAASPVPPAAAAAISALLGPPRWEGGIGGDVFEAEVTSAQEPQPGSLVPPPPPAKASRIWVVQQPPAAAEAEVEYVTSLAEACQRAAALSLTEIELAFSGPLVEKPFDVANPRLTLSAQPGSKPVVVFQPSAAERQMIRLAGSSTARLKAQGIEFRLELPQEVSSGWALVALNTGQTLELFDCVLTVQDGDRNQAPQHDQVAMIAVQRRRAADTMSMPDPQMAMAQSATIQMERCIARGEATLVSMADETPLSLSWTQGLLATSRRLIETGGSDSPMRKYWETISIELDSVTAYCPQGLYQMQRRAGRSNQYIANVKTSHCILITDPGAPLFEYIGVRDLTSEDLDSMGDSNRYPRPDMVFLRMVSGVPGEPPREAQLGSNLSTERRPQVSIPWLQPLRTDVPVHELTKADFAVDPSRGGGAGFIPGELPNISPSADDSELTPATPPEPEP
jgi:serine/threonine-protein kinase